MPLAEEGEKEEQTSCLVFGLFGPGCRGPCATPSNSLFSLRVIPNDLGEQSQLVSHPVIPVECSNTLQSRIGQRPHGSPLLGPILT